MRVIDYVSPATRRAVLGYDPFDGASLALALRRLHSPAGSRLASTVGLAAHGPERGPYVCDYCECPLPPYRFADGMGSQCPGHERIAAHPPMRVATRALYVIARADGTPLVSPPEDADSLA
jgi:hypothetical protein